MKNLELSGGETLLSIFAIALFVIGIIFFFRNYLRKLSAENIKRQSTNSNNLNARNKYENVNPFAWSKPIFFFGLASALATTLLAFSWTTYDKANTYSFAIEEYDELEVTPPPTYPKPPPPPPPPPPKVIEVEPEEIKEEEQPKFEDTTIDAEEAIEEPIIEYIEAPVAPPPPEPVEEEPEIFVFAEQMPRFPGCEDISGTEKEKRACAEKMLLQYINKKLKYPSIAKENNITGRAVIRFVVNESGDVTDINIVQDLGGGCGLAAKKAVESMRNMPQKWTPGKQRGRPVKVLYTLPITFRLQ